MLLLEKYRLMRSRIAFVLDIFSDFDSELKSLQQDSPRIGWMIGSFDGKAIWLSPSDGAEATVESDSSVALGLSVLFRGKWEASTTCLMKMVDDF